ncbi:DMT family transporter [Desulfitobacterium sp.]|uniref:DMT family transporter n=1 Tax=Desulfitobacterium sp. TaxID=49981 RepID=UPI002D0CF97A|nr:DMT family transporter [Desulfitobacterium sp.]HVJ50309.1 DMT family transporter [Desulfitobacterium sp.]
MPNQTTRLKSLDIVLWTVVLFWGTNYVIGKWGMLGFDPVTFNLLRFLGATPVLFLLLYCFERDLTVRLKHLPELAFVGLVGITIYQTLFMSAVKYATATNASLLLAASPVFTALCASLLGQEQIGRRGWFGSIMALSGVVLVLLFGTSKLSFSMSILKGNLIGILASFVWGIYPIISHRSLQKYSALKTLAYSALFGTIFYLFIGINGLFQVSWSNIPLVSYGSLLFSIGPVTAFGLVAWNYGFSKVGANRVMVYMYTIPIVAVASAALILRERMHLLQILGAVIIFVGIYFVRIDKENPAFAELQR